MFLISSKDLEYVIQIIYYLAKISRNKWKLNVSFSPQILIMFQRWFSVTGEMIFSSILNARYDVPVNKHPLEAFAVIPGYLCLILRSIKGIKHILFFPSICIAISCFHHFANPTVEKFVLIIISLMSLCASWTIFPPFVSMKPFFLISTAQTREKGCFKKLS